MTSRWERGSTSWIPIVIAVVVLGAAWVFLTFQPRTLRGSKMLMGTTVQVSLIGGDRAAMEAVFAAMERVNDLMSTYDPDSEISRLNQTKDAVVSPEIIEVLTRAQDISELTDGAFDVTVKPFLDVWNEARNAGRIPSSEELTRVSRRVGYQYLEIRGNRVRFARPGMEVDLGGIAKGYAVEQAVKALGRHGVRAALVNAGGDLYALGGPGKGSTWNIGIKDPRDPDSILEAIGVTDRAVATSGDYERYFMLEGRRFSHIVDPRTGETVENVPMSVTVVAHDGTTADALATGVFVLGPDAGMDLVERLAGVEALIVSEPGEFRASSGWADIARECDQCRVSASAG